MFLLIDWLKENMETIQLSLSLMTMLAEKEGKNPSASGSGLLTCTRFLNKQSLFNTLSKFTCPLSSIFFFSIFFIISTKFDKCGWSMFQKTNSQC